MYNFKTFFFETDRSLSFGKACKKAYKKALEPHHPLLVRTAAKAAWLVAPDRQKFYTMIAGHKKKIYNVFEFLSFLKLNQIITV